MGMKPPYANRQGQFLAFIHHYTTLHGRPPAEAEMARFFQVTPPSVHSTILTLERRGLITRAPGQARSIALRLPPRNHRPFTAGTRPRTFRHLGDGSIIPQCQKWVNPCGSSGRQIARQQCNHSQHKCYCSEGFRIVGADAEQQAAHKVH